MLCVDSTVGSASYGENLKMWCWICKMFGLLLFYVNQGIAFSVLSFLTYMKIAKLRHNIRKKTNSGHHCCTRSFVSHNTSLRLFCTPDPVVDNDFLLPHTEWTVAPGFLLPPITLKAIVEFMT